MGGWIIGYAVGKLSGFTRSRTNGNVCVVMNAFTADTSLASLEAELMETILAILRTETKKIRISLASLEAELMETFHNQPPSQPLHGHSLASLEAELMETWGNSQIEADYRQSRLSGFTRSRTNGNISREYSAVRSPVLSGFTRSRTNGNLAVLRILSVSLLPALWLHSKPN